MAAATTQHQAQTRLIALTGHPNVGKSALFHRLTGAYVTVSNYPGTTVETARAKARCNPAWELLDTPGVLSLPARSDDERAALAALLQEDCHVLLQVGDAKNLRRTLALTAVLATLGLPMVLALNMRDEAQARGVVLDYAALAEVLDIPVLGTVATANEGIHELIHHLNEARVPRPFLHYDPHTEQAICQIASWISAHCPHPRLAARGLAILFLGHDPEVASWLRQAAGERYSTLESLRTQGEQDKAALGAGKLAERLVRERSQAAHVLAEKCTHSGASGSPLLSQKIGQWVLHPLYGVPLLLATLYAVYQFVGVLGAQVLVGLLEDDLFAAWLNPAFQNWLTAHSPWHWLNELIIGPYGLWSMGMTYALALVLPIVTTFFFAFGMLEDSGYLPRLSVIFNRLFAFLGLNGRAVLPLVLGLGCVTMATLTTRILHSRRERLITTFLLALAIPCSAQLGVVLGMLGRLGFVVVLGWSVVIVAVLLLSGFLAQHLLPGRRIALVTELPPMRFPLFTNVMKKTLARLKWYLLEVIPLFLLGAFIMYVLDATGILSAIIRLGEPLVVSWLGLPKEASAAFVMGFVRRDFGATGLFALSNLLTPLQAVIGMVTITLFIPCFANLMMMIREHGWRIGLIMLMLVMSSAFLVGGLLHHLLRLFGFGG